jgi:hypothetical protein
MIDNINMNSTIGSMNDNINMNSTIGSMIDNICMLYVIYLGIHYVDKPQGLSPGH